MIKSGFITTILTVSALGCGIICMGNGQQEAGRFCYAAGIDGITGFEEKDYLKKLKIHEGEIGLIYTRFQKNAIAILKDTAGYTMQYDSRFMSMGIYFNERDWERNLRIHIHNAARIGFESVSPQFRIRDRRLGIDYCFFVGRTCPISQKELRRILADTYNMEKLPDAVFNHTH